MAVKKAKGKLTKAKPVKVTTKKPKTAKAKVSKTKAVKSRIASTKAAKAKTVKTKTVKIKGKGARLCSVCGKAIPKARLKILPGTTTCVKCATVERYSSLDIPDSAFAQPPDGARLEDEEEL